MSAKQKQDQAIYEMFGRGHTVREVADHFYKPVATVKAAASRHAKRVGAEVDFPTHPPLGREEYEMFLKLRSWTKVAARLGTTAANARARAVSWTNKNGLPLPRAVPHSRPRAMPSAKMAAAYALWRQGESWVHIAKELGISRNTARRWAKLHAAQNNLSAPERGARSMHTAVFKTLVARLAEYSFRDVNYLFEGLTETERDIFKNEETFRAFLATAGVKT